MLFGCRCGKSGVYFALSSNLGEDGGAYSKGALI